MNDRLRDSRCPFAAKCFSVYRRESDVTASFHCRDLLAYRGGIFAIEFSDDGTLLASGGNDVRLWPISQSVRQNPITSILMENRHDSNLVCDLAFAPDSSRLLSGGSKGKILIYDVQTWVSYRLSNAVLSPLKLFLFLFTVKGRNC